MATPKPLNLQQLIAQAKGWKAEYFSLWELLESEKALKKGLENRPLEFDVQQMHSFAIQVLDPIRRAWGDTIIVESGYRDADVNALVGGASTSLHQHGMAADIRPRFRGDSDDARQLRALYRMIVQMGKENGGHLHYGQLILYQGRIHIHREVSPRGGWEGNLFEHLICTEKPLAKGKVKKLYNLLSLAEIETFPDKPKR